MLRVSKRACFTGLVCRFFPGGFQYRSDPVGDVIISGGTLRGSFCSWDNRGPPGKH